jgi:hypothetical protein
LEGVGERDVVAATHDQTGLPILDVLRKTICVRAHHRHPVCLRLDHGVAEALRCRRVQEDVRPLVVGRDLRWRYCAHEVDHIIQAELVPPERHCLDQVAVTDDPVLDIDVARAQ